MDSYFKESFVIHEVSSEISFLTVFIEQNLLVQNVEFRRLEMFVRGLDMT